MGEPTEHYLVGLDYLEAATDLLDRIRLADPRAGLFEAAELQWWWGQIPRPTDDFAQLFWFDEHGRPEAGAIITDWRGSTQLDPLVLPDATPDWIAHVMNRGLDYAAEAGIDEVSLEVSPTDEVLQAVLSKRGLAIKESGVTESWLAPEDRPEISALHDEYALLDRTQNSDRPHPMINKHRDHTDPEPRLKQTSLYRTDLDLAIYNRDGSVGGYGLFWHNPVTKVGIVEPMRTNDAHQQRGLARHILTVGLDRLAKAGSSQIKICYFAGNAAANRLYTSVGFVPARENHLFAGPTGHSTKA